MRRPANGRPEHERLPPIQKGGVQPNVRRPANGRHEHARLPPIQKERSPPECERPPLAAEHLRVPPCTRRDPTERERRALALRTREVAPDPKGRHPAEHEKDRLADPERERLLPIPNTRALARVCPPREEQPGNQPKPLGFSRVVSDAFLASTDEVTLQVGSADHREGKSQENQLKAWASSPGFEMLFLSLTGIFRICGQILKISPGGRNQYSRPSGLE